MIPIAPKSTSPVSALAEVLIVSDDLGLHSQLGQELEAKGLQVMDCPGPGNGAPCIGLKSGACPLREAADVVVLDIHGGGSCYLDKTGRSGLAGFYGSAKRQVVVLADEADATPDASLNGVIRLSRMAPSETVVAEIEALTAPRAAVRGRQ